MAISLFAPFLHSFLENFHTHAHTNSNTLIYFADVMLESMKPIWWEHKRFESYCSYTHKVACAHAIKLSSHVLLELQSAGPQKSMQHERFKSRKVIECFWQRKLLLEMFVQWIDVWVCKIQIYASRWSPVKERMFAQWIISLQKFLRQHSL